MVMSAGAASSIPSPQTNSEIYSTVEGIVISFKEVQLQKANTSICVTLSGMLIETRLPQYSHKANAINLILQFNKIKKEPPQMKALFLW